MNEREPRNVQEIKLTLDLRQPKEIEKLRSEMSEFLAPEQIEQFIFVLQSMAAEDYTNQCNKATQALGARLADQFGDEESFFELAPSMRYFDARNYHHLDKLGYRGDHHSVGIVTTPPLDPAPVSIVVDLTYGDVSSTVEPHSIFVLAHRLDETNILKKIQDHYGGEWKNEFIFDPAKKQFHFLDPK